MGYVVTIGSSKGGVGKSTIAVNLAVCSAREGYKTLLIDCDKQQSAASWRAARDQTGKNDIAAISILQPTVYKDVETALKPTYDYIFIDCGGRDGGVFRSSILAADLFVIPCQTSILDLWANGTDTVGILREARGFKEIPAYFLLNMVIPNPMVSITEEASKALAEIVDVKLLESYLSARIAFKSLETGLGIMENPRGGKAANEMSAVWEEIKELLTAQEKAA